MKRSKWSAFIFAACTATSAPRFLIFDPFEHAAKVMIEFIAEIQKKTGFAIKELNLGGGFGIKYRSKDRPEAYGAIWAVWRALSRSTPHFAALKRLIFSLSRAAPLSARRGLRSTQSAR